MVFYMSGRVEPPATRASELTPRQIVRELDRHIGGQAQAKEHQAPPRPDDVLECAAQAGLGDAGRGSGGHGAGSLAATALERPAPSAAAPIEFLAPRRR